MNWRHPIILRTRAFHNLLETWSLAGSWMSAVCTHPLRSKKWGERECFEKPEGWQRRSMCYQKVCHKPQSRLLLKPEASWPWSCLLSVSLLPPGLDLCLWPSPQLSFLKTDVLCSFDQFSQQSVMISWSETGYFSPGHGHEPLQRRNQDLLPSQALLANKCKQNTVEKLLALTFLSPKIF